MRPIHAVLILLLSACASGHEYHQGAYRPAPPVFVPSQDAPHTFRPGRLSPVQPGPKPTRVLPETPETRREPGIWASGGGDAPGWNDPAPRIAVLDVEIPMPPEIVTAWDAMLAVQCSMRADVGLRTEHRLLARLRGMTPQERRCLAAAAFTHCAIRIGQRLQRHIEGKVAAGTANASEQLSALRVDSILGAALATVARECGDPIPASVRAAAEDIDGLMKTKIDWKGGVQ
jgi:hypothetical protein